MTIAEQIDTLSLRWQNLQAMLPPGAERTPLHAALALACTVGRAYAITLGHLVTLATTVSPEDAPAVLDEVAGILSESRRLLADAENAVVGGFDERTRI